MPIRILPDRHPRLVLALVLAAMCATAYPRIAAADAYEDFVFAVANDRASEVKAMLARGIDPNTVDKNGDPAIVVAARGGNEATIDALLAARADVNRRNAFGDTALMVAALNGQFAIAKKLREKGAAVDGPGWTPLIYAATGGKDDIVVWLLGQGANIDAQSPNGTTALMMAIRENRINTAELLIARGANPNLRNQNGASALDWAKRNDDKALVEKLKRAGARE
jgi:ankyrin repeat protein